MTQARGAIGTGRRDEASCRDDSDRDAPGDVGFRDHAHRFTSSGSGEMTGRGVEVLVPRKCRSVWGYFPELMSPSNSPFLAGGSEVISTIGYGIFRAAGDR